MNKAARARLVERPIVPATRRLRAECAPSKCRSFAGAIPTRQPARTRRSVMPDAPQDCWVPNGQLSLLPLNPTDSHEFSRFLCTTRASGGKKRQNSHPESRLGFCERYPQGQGFPGVSTMVEGSPRHSACGRMWIRSPSARSRPVASARSSPAGHWAQDSQMPG
jgi:hypothetical protein